MPPARDLWRWSQETAREMGRDRVGRVQPVRARRRQRDIEPRRRRAGWKAGGPSEPRQRDPAVTGGAGSQRENAEISHGFFKSLIWGHIRDGTQFFPNAAPRSH